MHEVDEGDGGEFGDREMDGGDGGEFEVQTQFDSKERCEEYRAEVWDRLTEDQQNELNTICEGLA